jgi:hypothetical protein
LLDGRASLQHYRPGGSAELLSLKDSFYEIWIRNRIRFILFNLPFLWWPLLFTRLLISVFMARDAGNRLYFAPSFPRRLAFFVRGVASALANPSPLNTKLRPAPPG